MLQIKYYFSICILQTTEMHRTEIVIDCVHIDVKFQFLNAYFLISLDATFVLV